MQTYSADPALAHGPGTPGLLSVEQLAAIVAARRRLILRVAGAIVAATALLVLVLPSVWTASADVYIDYPEENPVAGRELSPLLDDSYLQTQLDLLGSEVVAEEAARALDLAQTDAYRESARKLGESRAHRALIDGIVRSTRLSRGGNSRVITVSYSARSPQEARDLANAIVNAYISVSQQIAGRAARSRSEQYNTQLEELRREADAIQERLTRYQQETGILDPSEQNDLATRQLNELTTQLAQLQSRRQQAQAAGEAARRMLADGVRVEDLPEIAGLPVIDALKAGLSGVSQRLNDAAAVLGPRHPTVRGLAAERDGLAARIRSEAQAAHVRRQNEAGMLQAQEKALLADIDRQRALLLEQKTHRDRIMSYQRQLASVEQVYRTALQKYDGLLMASTITPPSLTVLRAADLPDRRSRPRVLLSLAASVVVGLLAGLCAALLLELLQRRVRCAQDVARPGLPLLGRIGYYLPSPAALPLPAPGDEDARAQGGRA